MNKSILNRKTIAWSLIIALANPALLVAPAVARDTDIYLTNTNGITTTGSINSGSTTLNDASSGSYTVGMVLDVDGAGIGGTPLSAAITNINTVTNQITLATAASNTVSNTTVTNGNTTTAEPNVLLILGTNDRMNIPESWREYTDGSTTGSIASGSNSLTVASIGSFTVGTSLAIAGAGVNGAALAASITAIAGNTISLSASAANSVTSAQVLFYDSHAEYLWNDINIISNNTAGAQAEVTAESAGAISDAAESVTPFSPWGFWDSTLAPAQQLWQAVKYYANSTLPGDPGPQYVFRNYYNDSSWLYWLPTGTSTTDLRLSAVSFNRFRAGPSNYVASTRGGIVYPPTSPTTPYNYTTINSSFAAYNLCAQTNSTLNSPLIPSTIMAPTNTPSNAGIWTNQQWIRWEPYLNLATVGNANYPGGSTVYNTYYQGYLDSSFSPPTNGFNVPPVAGAANPLGYAGPPYRDSLNSTTAVSTGATGLPIRIQRTVVASPTTTPALDVSPYKSYAGWTNVAADLGGYTFVPTVLNGLGTTGYPYSCPVSFAGITPTTACTASSSYAVLQTVLGWYGITTELGGSWPLTAFKGNRDSGPVFGMMTGAPAYYDTTTACNPTTGASASGTCIGIASGGTAAQSATWTLTCGYTPGYREEDARNTVLSNSGTCTIRPTTGNPTCSDPRTSPTYVAPHLNCGDFPAPTTCPAPTQVADPAFYTQDIPTTTCTAAGRSSLTVGTCAWSGRQSLFIEGQGYYYYGGSCQETGGGSPSTSSCTATGSTLTLDGTSESNVLGPYTSAQDNTYETSHNPGVFTASGNALGCSNAITAGPYAYGGTCSGGSKYNVSTTANETTAPLAALSTRTTTAPLTTCAFVGASALTIRGNSQNFNGTCETTESNIQQACLTRYGVTCDNSASNVTTGFPLNNTAVCPNNTTTDVVIASTAATTYYYQAYKLNTDTVNLYHECVSDGPLALNSGGSYPTSYMRTFATAANTSATATANTQLSDAYVTSGAPVAQRYVADTTKNIDVYSVNYLNWLYGAKACRNAAGSLITSGSLTGAGVTCTPIARKSRLQIAKDALSTVVENTNGVRIGLEVFNKTDTSLDDNGGNIQYAIRRMGSNSSDLPAFNNRQTLANAIQAVVASSRSPLTESMYEAYLYFSGRTPMFGTLSTTAESGGTVSAGYDPSVGTNSDVPANTVYLLNSSGTYNSPMMNNPTVAAPAACQKNFIVFISNGQPEYDFTANAAIKTMRWTNPTLGTHVSPQTNLDSNYANGTTYNQIQAIPGPGGAPYLPVDLATTAYDGGYIWLDELAYFMSNADVSPGASDFIGENLTDQLPGTQSINTYTIGFAGVNTPVLANAAQVANGTFFTANNAQQLGTALTQAFVAIANWTPTAAFLTVPLNTLNRGQSSDNVFLAFFGPSPQEAWQGTLKKFELGTTAAQCGTGIDLCLIGQTLLSSGTYNIDALDPLTGQTIVDPTASSFWGPANLQDGPQPNKGGDGYQLISNTPGFVPNTRNVYTFLSNGVSTSTNLTAPSNSTNPTSTMITPAMLGTGSTVTWETLLSYIRGGSTADPNCTDGNPATVCTTWAAWPHFDIQHSRPAVVTYDGTQNPPVQEILYVQDNGMLTAVDANTGLEKWSFLIEEALPQLSSLMANNNGPEIYVADGSPAVFYDDENGDGIIEPGTDRVWLYFGLRRGGRVLYAIDITVKDQPQFMWKITANSGTGMVCTGTSTCVNNPLYNQLGQTWSTPQIGPINYLGAAPGYIPALIFAGGYDTLEDALPWVGSSGADTIGRAVYVVRADNAQVINSWGVGQPGSYQTVGGQITTFSIPSDVTALNTQNSAQGYLDRVYVGDLGGNVWRFDISTPTPSNWKGEQLASLSNATGEKRKFFFPPAVAPQNSPLLFDAVYIGSGDTEHPICSTAGVNGCAAAVATDRIFMLMDDPSLDASGGTPGTGGVAEYATPITSASLYQLQDTNICGTGGTGATCTNQSASDLLGKQGWYRGLDVGEKVTNSPSVFFNQLDFATYAPAAQINSCTPPGEGRLNQIGALLGNLEPLNGGTVASSNSRYYSDFVTPGYISSGQLLVVGNQVINTAESGGVLHATQVGTIGGASKIYWYMVPEQ